MGEEEAFVQGILDDPKDVALRLVYADWLEERGDLRADYLRVDTQIQLLAGPERSVPDLRRRRLELETRIDPAWVSLVSPRWNDLPDFGDYGRYRCDPYIRAAVLLQSRGYEAARDVLSMLADTSERGRAVIILCRMLFVGKQGASWSPPRLGRPAIFGDTDPDVWSLLPIELADGVPFLITFGYALFGVAESGASYLRRTLIDCEWSDSRFTRKTTEEKERALTKLFSSPKWRTPLEDHEKERLSVQVEPFEAG